MFFYCHTCLSPQLHWMSLLLFEFRYFKLSFNDSLAFWNREKVRVKDEGVFYCGFVWVFLFVMMVSCLAYVFRVVSCFSFEYLFVLFVLCDNNLFGYIWMNINSFVYVFAFDYRSWNSFVSFFYSFYSRSSHTLAK